MPKCGTKMPYLGIFGLEVEKFCEETKMLKFWTKNAFYGIFGLEFKETMVIFEISTLNFVFNSYSEFGIGSAFSKDPPPAFSEGPGQGLQYTFFFYKQSKI